MARMHSRKRGRSQSIRPLSKTPPPWVPLAPDEVENLVIKMAKEGMRPSMIGTVLRDSYGVPLVRSSTGKRLLKLLKDNNLAPEVPEDLANLIERARRMHIHLAKNRSDRYNRHKLQLVEAKIHRLLKYYKRIGAVPSDFQVKSMYTYA
ncbi:MAG: 30S ribosomal protein S15 [Aigarchaeota archaeon]|nr:30S ribosomal protein S15 [Aigarchaeota archaeon]MDW8092712.1 30S ribosomal protein S15 [Nitrososphaerota archaeon]